MEEWRAVLADSLLFTLQVKELLSAKILKNLMKKGDILDGKGSKVYIAEYEKRCSRTSYITYVDYAVSFGVAIEMQCQRLAKAVEEEDPIYTSRW